MALLVLLCAMQVPAQDILQFHRANSGLIDNHVNALALLQGAPLVATSKGVSWRQPDRWESWRAGENGLPDAPVTSAVVFGGNLWVGTLGKGVARLSESRWKSFSQADSGLMDDFVTCLVGWGSRLVVGTREGVCHFDGTLWNRIALEGISGPLQVTSLAVGRDLLLVGTAQGLFLVDGTLRSRRVDLGVSPIPWVQAVAVGSEYLFVAHDAGLTVLQPDGRPAVTGYDRTQVGRISGMAVVDRDVLCATNHGMLRVAPGAGVTRLALSELGVAELTVSALIEAGGDWYFGTTGNGVFRVPSGRLSGDVRATGAGDARNLPVQLSDVRVFPPPVMANQSTDAAKPQAGAPGQGGTFVNSTVVDPRSMIPKVPAGAAGDRPGTTPFWTLHQRPVKPSNLAYHKDILPMIVKKCLTCHTSGTGKYFPLNDPKIVIAYFRKAGTGRFEQFLAEGGGMFGLVDAADAELIKIWVDEGCRE